MLLRIIDDVYKCLDSEAYIAALSLALTIPDICGLAEYGKKCRVGKRYAQWYDEYITKYEIPASKDSSYNFPVFSGEVVYLLRCKMLHQGTPNVDYSDVSNEDNKVDKLVVEYSKDSFYYGGSVSIYHDNISNLTQKTFTLNLNNICIKICRAAEGYYKGNKEKFNFFVYELNEAKVPEYDEELMNKFIMAILESGKKT